jgi:hypothetical protein
VDVSAATMPTVSALHPNLPLMTGQTDAFSSKLARGPARALP